MARRTQADRVLNYIKVSGSISRREAMEELGVANLPAVIDDLRHIHGYNIVTDIVKAKNRYDENISYARYYLAEEDC